MDRPLPPNEIPLEQRVKPNDVIAGKYRVESVIGSGGMGLVVAAKHLAMGHRVAIKLLRLEEEKDPKGAISRFVREARATARIQSDHVVRVHDVAALPDGTPFMVMEILKGRDLKHILHERDQLPIDEAIGYVLQACEGLAEAHAAGVIHRDLKPSNLFLAEKANGEKVIKVLDFGISKLLSRPGDPAMSTTNSLMGSPLYMAPEQMRSSKDVDARADVWSLGLILYELLSGEPAFAGETIPEVCMNVMTSDPAAISRYRNDVPQELQAILVKALAKERDERYESMGELARALEKFGRDPLRVHADRASAAVKSARGAMLTLPEDADVPPDAVPTIDAPAPLPPRAHEQPDELPPSWIAKPRRASKRTAWIAAGIAVCALAAMVGTLAAKRTSAAPSSASNPAPSPAPSGATLPAPSDVPSDVPSVSFDSLPKRPPPPPHAPARTPTLTPPPSRAPTHAQTPSPPPKPAPSASSKEDWQWGDRN